MLQTLSHFLTGTTPDDTSPIRPAFPALSGRLVGMAFAAWFIYVYTTLLLTRQGLTGIECYYWDWSRQLDWAYYSKPPLIAYVIRLGTAIFGNTEFGVRCTMPLFHLASLGGIYLLTRRITEDKTAAYAATLFALAVTAQWGWWFQAKTDSIMAPFWVLAVYFFHRAIRGERAMWLVAGCMLGIGALAKYTILLLAVSFLIYLVVAHPRKFKTPGPYLMAAALLLCNAGVLYWNAAHDWPSLRHTVALGAVAQDTPWQPVVRLGQYGLDQLGCMALVLSPFALAAVMRLGRAAARRNPDALLLFCCFIVTLAFYAIVAMSRDSFPHWAYNAWWMAFPAFAVFRSARPWNRCLRGIFAIGVILALLLSAAVPSIHGDTTGPHLGAALTRQLDAAPDPKPFIFTLQDRYSAWAAFYTEGNPRTYIWPDGTEPTQYHLWDGWADFTGRDALLLMLGDAAAAQDRLTLLTGSGAFAGGAVCQTFQVQDSHDEPGVFSIIALKCLQETDTDKNSPPEQRPAGNAQR